MPRLRQLFASLLVLCPAALPALADGAFPDELSVYLPTNDANRIMLGTNFGLVISEDAAKSWRFVCELYITGSGADLVNYYKIASDGAILAITYVNLWRSTDGGCTWTLATFADPGVAVTDAFIDPNNPKLVLALGQPAGTNGMAIYPSSDGGATFGKPVYQTNNVLTGIEIAKSSPPGSVVVYATENHPATSAGGAFLLRSDDGGQSWPPTGKVQLAIPAKTEPRIAGVDPDDANKVYLRLLTISDPTDAIAITTDNGAHLADAASLTNVFFTSFLRAADGTLYAGTSSSDLYVAPPGTSALTKRVGPRARCLGQRAGVAGPANPIFACGDGFLDGYNLGKSDDGAATFQKLMRFQDIQGPLTCPAVQSACAVQYLLLMQTLGGAPDAGTPAGGGTPPSQTGGGSHCQSIGPAGALALCLLGAFTLRRRRSRLPPIKE